MFSCSGTIVDIFSKKLYPGTVFVEQGRIVRIEKDPTAKTEHFILPGFIDAHIHIESSMLIPSEFARLASVHGTVATVSDPHEIANVLGIDGVRYMIDNAKKVPFHFYFGAPSCVPATSFETAGAAITKEEIEELFKKDHLRYLSEMMNFPGVLTEDAVVMEKIAIAKRYNKPIDGHAPGLKDPEAYNYIKAGMTTDHECYTLEEALGKVSHGMKILIREGSAAKNYEELHTLLKTHPDMVMFCSDDKHPNELVKGHINEIVKRSVVEKGYDLMQVLRAACLHPVQHYNLDVGLLRQNDSADFIVVDSLKEFTVLKTYIKGQLVAEHGKTHISSVQAKTPNNFHTKPKSIEDFVIAKGANKIHVIQAEDGQLITHDAIEFAAIKGEYYVTDISRDLLKLAVVNRYTDARPAKAFVKNFGLQKGALASCIAHDSHNIIAVGCSDEELCRAVNVCIKNKGGIALVYDDQEHSLSLPVAGIMSNEDGYVVAEQYKKLQALAHMLKTPLHDPFMTLSFMALLVIPELKLSDKGLFDVLHFHFCPLD